jgi:PEP-CTERM motif
MNKYKLNGLAALLLGLSIQMPAYAAVGDNFSLAFYNITTPAVAADVLDGQTSLLLSVTDVGSNRVSFKFTNDSNFSSLTDVYFDSGPLASIYSITSSAGVSFSQGSSPPNLPGGNAISPAFDGSALTADSNNPPPANGVQNSDVTNEQLTITFNLLAGKNWNNVVTSLSLPGFPIESPVNSWLRVGVHVQSFQSGNSASFINNPVTAVPEPETYAMLLAGLALVGRKSRKRA